ncbi:MAG TPA: hypothetical protein VGB18_03530 [Candidatus Thermoplasmatota archaeon]
MKGPVALGILMLPCLGLLAGYGSFAAACEDDFCPALLLEAGLALVATSALVATFGWTLLRRGRGLWRSGAAAWAVAIAVGALVFAASQFVEGDVAPAVSGLVVVLAASFFAWSAARAPYTAESTPA